MLYNSVNFLIFFPVVVLFYRIIPVKYKYIWLLAASYYFYMCWNAKYALLLLLSTAITYFSGLLIDKIGKLSLADGKKVKLRKLCVALSFISNLSILVVFKYFDFIIQNLNAVLKALHTICWNCCCG